MPAPMHLPLAQAETELPSRFLSVIPPPSPMPRGLDVGPPRANCGLAGSGIQPPPLDRHGRRVGSVEAEDAYVKMRIRCAVERMGAMKERKIGRAHV